jgi:hypothetical protein
MLDATPPQGWSVLEVARQRGKTFAVLLWALQQMGRDASTAAVYLAQTGGNAEAIVTQFLREVEEGLPPEWGCRVAGGVLSTRAGAELAFFGTDNEQYRRRRGRKARLVLLDEAAFYADLLDVEQVYTPQLQTTNGIGVYLSSPPLSPAHPFVERCRSAKAAGRYAHGTFWENPRINHEAVIQGECQRLGLTREELLKSTAFRREYLAETVTEETRAAFPSWTPEREKVLVGEWQRPELFDAYVGVDWGFGDPHGALWCWYDFPSSTLFVEDELELRGATVTDWAAQAKAKETHLYGPLRYDGTLAAAVSWDELPPWLVGRAHASAPKQPFLRIGDNDPLVLAELAAQHGYAVLPTRKDDKALAVDAVNALLVQQRIKIHSRCRRLREQLYTTLWNVRRSGWERTTRDHGDLVDCLVYVARNVAWHRDPRPPPPAWDLSRPKSGWARAFGL